MESDFTSKNIKAMTFAVVGMGLMGGSYAKALRRLGAKKIIAVDRSDSVLEKCAALGLADNFCHGGEALAESDVMILCIYPDGAVKFLEENSGFISGGTIITDILGIKRDILERAHKLLPADCEYISGHPMAGRESGGIEMANDKIFENANYIIIPTEHNSEEACVWLENFAEALGCVRSIRVSAAEHDKIIAYTSMLPHVIAASLINCDSFTENTKSFIGGSFRDGTRVADINPNLWTNNFLQNKANLITEIDKMTEQLQNWKKALDADDEGTLRRMMMIASLRTREIPNRRA